MQLSCEYLPATDQARQELVLLHGWGSVPAIWRNLLADLRPWADIWLLEIPGCAPGTPAQPSGESPVLLEDALDAVLACSPPRAVFLGWSLGGQLALEIARRYPARAQAVITLCSNPSFLQRADWPGMTAQEFEGFRQAFSADPVAGQRRFESLQVSGSAQARQRLRELRQLQDAPASAHMEAGLEWLESLDQREYLPSLACPQLHLLAARDKLVPPEVRPALASLLADTPGTVVATLEDCSHVATLDAPGQVAGAVEEFLAGAALLRPVRPRDEQLAKRDIADSFSRAAPLYDSVAQLQRDVGTQLLARLDELALDPARILDLGCGTGYFCADLYRRFPRAEYLGLDIAHGMVEYARAQQDRSRGWLVGDAEALPLAAGSVDLVFSSLAIQWCYRPRLLLAELARVLRPGGYCVFTSLGPGTLRELRNAWAEVDDHQHVNRFLPAAELQEAAERLGDARLWLDGSRFRMEYRSVRELLTELKTLGAHNMNRDRPGGLTSRRALQGMLQAYEEWREGGLLPATYDVIFGTLEAR